jgi:RNA polymerase sigma-70 factor (ECF subfamily)
MERARDKGPRRLRLVAEEEPPAQLPAFAAPGREEVALAAALLGGDRLVLDGVVRANAERVLAVLRRYARAPHDARDLAQEAFRRALLAARRALRADPQRAVPFRRWLLRATLALARDHLRREVFVSGARLEQLGPAEEVPGLPRGPQPVPERAARARSEVLLLPRRLREVVTLRIDPELSFPEIAQVLRITETAAALDFHDAARRLRDGAGGPKPGEAPCRRYDVLLSSRAAGALERGESARVEAHLAGCLACSAVADATAAALELAALGPASVGERALADELAPRVVAAVERAERRRAAGRRLAVVALAAASTVLAAAALVAGRAAHP